MYVGLSDLAREQGDLQAATRHLRASKDLGEHMGYPQNRYRHVVTARIRQAEGDLDGALDAIHEAQRLYMPDFIPDVRPLPAQEARILLRQGRLAEANAWARARGLSPHDDLTYLREFEHVTLARVLLAQSTLDLRTGLPVTLRYWVACCEQRRTVSGWATSSKSLSCWRLPTRCEATCLPLLPPSDVPWRSANRKAMFASSSMRAHHGGPLQDAANRGSPRTTFAASDGLCPPRGHHAGNQEALIEPLSDRELDVLRLLGTDPAGRKSPASSVSLSTVRSTPSIYAKLGVNNRRSAVTRAEELDLLREPATGP